MKRFRELSPPTLLILSFFSAIVIGTILLLLPISTVSGKISFLDALFTSTSAICVTGLIVVDTATYFTTFGKIVIMTLFQLGGLGIMTFTSLIFLIAKKNFTFSEKTLIEESLPSQRGVSTKKFIRDIFIFTFLIELSGAVILYIGSFAKQFNTPQAILHSIFHSISAFNNAGFSTFSDSLIKFNDNHIINLTILFLIVVGGLGFFVVRDLWYKINGKEKGHRLSLHTKLVLITSTLLIIIGFIFFFLLEHNHALSGKTTLQKLYISLFQSITPRTAGFNTIDLTLLYPATGFLLIILMVIGASPGSTGGGMKTTTWATLLLFLRTKLKGKQNVQAFGRNIAWEIIDKAHLILLFSIVTIFGGVFLISMFEGNKFSLLQIFFEEVSAYGTVGLSFGITSSLSKLSKIVIILTMFVGRVGILNFIYAFVSESKGAKFEYPEEKIMVG